MSTKVKKATLDAALKELEAQLERRRERGEVVKIIEPPYHKGLSTVRCVLEVDGVVRRMFFLVKGGIWRTS